MSKLDWEDLPLVDVPQIVCISQVSAIIIPNSASERSSQCFMNHLLTSLLAFLYSHRFLLLLLLFRTCPTTDLRLFKQTCSSKTWTKTGKVGDDLDDTTIGPASSALETTTFR